MSSVIEFSKKVGDRPRPQESYHVMGYIDALVSKYVFIRLQNTQNTSNEISVAVLRGSLSAQKIDLDDCRTNKTKINVEVDYCAGNKIAFPNTQGDAAAYAVKGLSVRETATVVTRLDRPKAL